MLIYREWVSLQMYLRNILSMDYCLRLQSIIYLVVLKFRFEILHNYRIQKEKLKIKSINKEFLCVFFIVNSTNMRSIEFIRGKDIFVPLFYKNITFE